MPLTPDQPSLNSPAVLAHPVTVEEGAVAESSFAQLERAADWLAAAAQTLAAPQTCDLSVIIPVFNEPDTVLDIVARVRRLAISKQIIVVNDGSTDHTSQTLEHLQHFREVRVVHHPVNAGKGAALQTGFQLATGKYVIVQDADLEYDPGDILNVIQPLRDGTADVVYGSRYLAGPQQDPSALHRWGNWLLTSLSNLMTGYRLTDMETCYKAFRREVLQQIHIEQKRFGFEPEITAKLAKRGVKITEVPIRYASRGWKEGKKIGVGDLISTLCCIVRYRLFR